MPEEQSASYSTILKDMHEKAYQRFLLWKRITYFLDSYDLKAAYSRSTKEQHEQLARLVNVGNLPAMRHWALQNCDLRDLSFRQLQVLAKYSNIPGYSRLNHNELLDALSR